MTTPWPGRDALRMRSRSESARPNEALRLVLLGAAVARREQAALRADDAWRHHRRRRGHRDGERRQWSVAERPEHDPQSRLEPGHRLAVLWERQRPKGGGDA